MVLTLVLPHYTHTKAGPMYSDSQLAFIAVVSLVLYGTFVFVQTIRHRNYFLEIDDSDIAKAYTPTTSK